MDFTSLKDLAFLVLMVVLPLGVVIFIVRLARSRPEPITQSELRKRMRRL